MPYMKKNFSFILLSITIICSLFACSNSENIYYSANEPFSVNEEMAVESLPNDTEYIPLDDTGYPYAGIPRIVIETENFRQIKDRETEIPAKMQIYGSKSPETDIMRLTIRGRGNTSWTDMPKKSYKIELFNKQSMLGMPKDRDWALIANYADKTLMKNYLMYHLSTKLGAYYAPRSQFVELFINKEYLGIYLLSETIKIAKNRINIPENDSSYIVEFDERIQDKQASVFYSNIISNDYKGKTFQIRAPKEISKQTLSIIEEYINQFELYITSKKKLSDSLANYIDISEYLKHYWVQEFSKNPDAGFNRSVFFSWKTGDVIKLGPVWDFDLSLGGHNSTPINITQNWFLKDSYWNEYIFSDSTMALARTQYWKENRYAFKSVADVADSIQKLLNLAAINNFKRWPILQSTKYSCHLHSYDTYKDAVDDLKLWLQERLSWIDTHLEN